jgi:hypothetical protein
LGQNSGDLPEKPIIVTAIGVQSNYLNAFFFKIDPERPTAIYLFAQACDHDFNILLFQVAAESEKMYFCSADRERVNQMKNLHG